MKRIDKLLSDKGVTRFSTGNFSDQIFSLYDLKYMLPVEHWTINWSHFDNMANVDIMTQGTAQEIAVQRAVDLDLNTKKNPRIAILANEYLAASSGRQVS